METREVLNISIGTYANYISTHWWNMQKAAFRFNIHQDLIGDINNDTMFGWSNDFQNDFGYCPRVVVIDTKRNLESLTEHTSLVRPGHRVFTDAQYGNPEILAGRPLPQNLLCSDNAAQIYDLNDVQKWSEYLEVKYSARTSCPIDNCRTEWSDMFSVTYSQGLETYNIENTKDMIENSLRLFAEECNYLQGFHIIVDGNNSFSGIGSGVVDHFNDEYSKKMIMMFPVYENMYQALPAEKERKELLCRLYCILNGLKYMSCESSLVSPLSLAYDITMFGGLHSKFPLLSYKPELMYHTSAILAATIENLTLPYRLMNRSCDMTTLINNISPLGRKVVSTGVNFPYNFDEKMHIGSFSTVTPFFELKKQRILAQSAVLRGVSNSNHEWSPTVLKDKCSIARSFPRILLEQAYSNGYIKRDEHAQQGVATFPMCTVVSNCNSIGNFLNSVLQKAENLSANDFSVAMGVHSDADELEEVLSALCTLRDMYSL